MSKTYRGPFAKVYRALWDGTLGPNAQAWTTWVLLLAHADAEGVVEMTPEALAARGGLDPDWVRKGLDVLEAPDPESRTAEQDGRRIVRLDEHRSWGWRIVNHALYRNQTDAERARSYRGRRVTPRDANVTTVTQRHQAEADVDVEEPNLLAAPAADSDRKALVKAADLPRYSEPFARFWENYAPCPRRTKKPQAWAEWRRASGDLISDQILAGLAAYKRSEQWRTGFMPEPARWLKGRVWEDADGLGEMVQAEESDGERANRRGQDQARALIERMTGRRPQW